MFARGGGLGGGEGIKLADLIATEEEGDLNLTRRSADLNIGHPRKAGRGHMK